MPFLPTKWLYWDFLLLFFFTIPAYAQINLTGRVLDESDDAPLVGASIYFNYTTIGTYSNQQGNFHFEAIRLPGTELVVYAPGYEILVFTPTAEQVQGKKFVFKLPPKEKAVFSKMVVPENVRNRWLGVFKGNLLGITEEASKSSILNEGAIYFLRGTSETMMVAYADTPLVIINNMLGYKIIFNLVEFWYDNATGNNYFLGYSRYESIDNNKQSIRNRKRAYGGSALHFYRSLISNQLYQQGFGTFLMQSLKDTGTAGLPTGAALVSKFDSMMMAVPVAAPEILYIDSTNNLSIRIAGRLLVQYEKDPAAKKSILQKGLVNGMLSKGVESTILFKTAYIGINSGGVLSDYSKLSYSGYWMYERLANMLPYDYVPD
jgi:CarboxypepD_reg-like domain